MFSEASIKPLGTPSGQASRPAGVPQAPQAPDPAKERGEDIAPAQAQRRTRAIRDKAFLESATHVGGSM